MLGLDCAIHLAHLHFCGAGSPDHSDDAAEDEKGAARSCEKDEQDSSKNDRAVDGDACPELVDGHVFSKELNRGPEWLTGLS